jgi:hypothetical protein
MTALDFAAQLRELVGSIAGHGFGKADQLQAGEAEDEVSRVRVSA